MRPALAERELLERARASKAPASDPRLDSPTSALHAASVACAWGRLRRWQRRTETTRRGRASLGHSARGRITRQRPKSPWHTKRGAGSSACTRSHLIDLSPLASLTLCDPHTPSAQSLSPPASVSWPQILRPAWRAWGARCRAPHCCIFCQKLRFPRCPPSVSSPGPVRRCPRGSWTHRACGAGARRASARHAPPACARQEHERAPACTTRETRPPTVRARACRNALRKVTARHAPTALRTRSAARSRAPRLLPSVPLPGAARAEGGLRALLPLDAAVWRATGEVRAGGGVALVEDRVKDLQCPVIAALRRRRQRRGHIMGIGNQLMDGNVGVRLHATEERPGHGGARNAARAARAYGRRTGARGGRRRPAAPRYDTIRLKRQHTSSGERRGGPAFNHLSTGAGQCTMAIAVDDMGIPDGPPSRGAPLLSPALFHTLKGNEDLQYAAPNSAEATDVVHAKCRRPKLGSPASVRWFLRRRADLVLVQPIACSRYLRLLLPLLLWPVGHNVEPPPPTPCRATFCGATAARPPTSHHPAARTSRNACGAGGKL